MTVGVAIVTYNSAKHLAVSLPLLLASKISLRVLIVDASSTDDTQSIAKKHHAEVLNMPYEQFNHGISRELARKYLATEIVIFMTPDAYLVDGGCLERLIEPLKQNKASIAYARQIPHEQASFFEKYIREFNYPAASNIRSINELPLYGSSLFFSSNSCCAYLNSVLDEIQGFSYTIIGEDQIAAAKALLIGHKIAYVSSAIVKHSHRYSLKDEIQRYFDLGVMKKMQKELFLSFGTFERVGLKYAASLIISLIKNKPQFLFYGFFHVMAKAVGFFLGSSLSLPKSWKKRLSRQKFFWRN